VKLRYDPFPLVFAQGDEVIKLACLELFGLGDSHQAKACLLKLIKQQRSDGAFPSELDSEEWGMRETVRRTLLLLQVGLPPEGVNVASAVAFIMGHQRPDGGWSENRALKLPPEQTWLSNERSITWLTADIVELLRQVGRGEHRACTVALKRLRTMQNRQGGWPSLAEDVGDAPNGTGDPDATAQITFLMGEIYGEEDPVYRRGRELFERHLDARAQDLEKGYWVALRDGKRMEFDVYALTHLLLSWWLDPPRRLQRGYDASDPRVRGMMEALVDIQREDGGWRPFFAEESSPVYTFLAVKVLILGGMLAQEELEADVSLAGGGGARDQRPAWAKGRLDR
jgi:hypothetical protein